jgi:hypothetical protein
MEGTTPTSALRSPPSNLSTQRPDNGAPFPTQSGSNDLSVLGLSLRLSDEEQSAMMQSIASIFELEEEQVAQDESMDDGDEDVKVDLEDQNQRTDRLKRALSTLAQLWWPDSEYMDLVAEKLADGSRDREPSLLQYFIFSEPLILVFFSRYPL